MLEGDDDLYTGDDIILCCIHFSGLPSICQSVMGEVGLACSSPHSWASCSCQCTCVCAYMCACVCSV